ncbi:MAG: tubulin-like doman-containing protein [Pirellulales bacterium]
MSTETQTCDIVIPGYTLTDRIGAGGYAEVWRAEAPGGLQKAVKVVYGYYDDEFASQELKALERIKGVRHPFLLSLERFEVVNGRLAILTELADMSLDQRLRQCRADGHTGIPREELLRYMADAAEALDFLSQRHSLMHLDIKPENLLILGDHIKVADFGLVKELATRTQNSLISGMTPTYASPEMFDDEPSAASDQYSLAIVYQEMLVGTLPFPGRTAAQLAKQHTQAEPQLMSLPAEDRPIVAKALAKKAVDRFPTCRTFVEALVRRTVAAPVEAPKAAPQPPTPSAPAPDDTKTPRSCATLLRSPGQALDELDIKCTRPVKREAPAESPVPAPEPFIPEDSAEVAVPQTLAELSKEQPTLFVALGGVGIQVLNRYRALTASDDPDEEPNPLVAAVALDTDRNELREACGSHWKQPLSPDDTLHLPLRLPKSYDNSREILSWVSKRWLYNIPRSLETRGYRPLGRVALVDHTLQVLALVDKKLAQLAQAMGGEDAARNNEKVRIVVLAGTGGGTGAGTAIDVANAVRSLAVNRSLAVEVQGFLVCTCFGTANGSPLLAANTYCLLTELHHAAELGNKTSDDATRSSAFESHQAPFDAVYLVPTRARAGEVRGNDPLDVVAKYLALETRPETRAALRSCRTAKTPREELRGPKLSIRKLGLASLTDRKLELIQQLARELAEEVKRHWLEQDKSANWEKLVRDEARAASLPKVQAPVEGDPNAAPAVVPVNDATPLALRGRFKEQMALRFTSEMLQEVERLLKAHDDRGRPILVAREAKQIADAGRVAAEAFVRRKKQPENGRRFSDSPVLRSLVAAASVQVLGHAIEKFDAKQPERFLAVDAIDELVRSECEALLDARIAEPEIRAALTALMQLDDAVARTIDQATMDLLQCGCDRRTLVVAPRANSQAATVEKCRAARPLAAVVESDVDDVLVVTEDAGLSPRSLALGFERVFPGIADAARRLHTRVDVEWKGPV